MGVPAQYVGVPFRQNAATLKIYTEGKPGERRVSQRPRKNPQDTSTPFVDSDEQPTLVEFKATDDVDVDGLLATGAIELYTPPKAAAAAVESKAAPKGGDSTG